MKLAVIRTRYAATDLQTKRTNTAVFRTVFLLQTTSKNWCSCFFHVTSGNICEN